MDELEIRDVRAEDELETQADGSTFVLGAEGWEQADFVDPDDDWRPLSDGSYLSPDGAIRSWPVAGPGPI